MMGAIKYNTDKPQTVRGIGGVQTFTFAGRCAVCGARIYSCDNGADPDYRGFVNDRHAQVTLTPDRTGKTKTVKVCAACANDGNSYRKACGMAE